MSAGTSLPAPPSLVPLLNGKKKVSFPSKRVAIYTSYWLTAKCTKAPRLKLSKGSAFLVAGSIAKRVVLYCLMAFCTACLNSDFNSNVAMGKPLTNKTKSMRHALLLTRESFFPVAANSSSFALLSVHQGLYTNSGTTRKRFCL